MSVIAEEVLRILPAGSGKIDYIRADIDFIKGHIILNKKTQTLEAFDNHNDFERRQMDDHAVYSVVGRKKNNNRNR